MKDTTKLIITALMILILLGLASIGIYAYVTWEDEIKTNRFEYNPPKIKENYNNIELTLVKESKGNLYLEDNDIYEMVQSNNEYDLYYFGTYGKIYTNKIKVEDKEENIIYNKKYKIYYSFKEEKSYYINLDTNFKSGYYDEIYGENCDKNEYNCKYLILDNNKILNTSTDKLIELDKNVTVKSNYCSNNNKSNEKYFVIYNKSYKYGVIDNNKNIMIDMVYDNMDIYNSNLILATKNLKYGIIDINNNIIMDFIYDGIEILKDYIILLKDGKIAVLDRNYKVLVNYTINYDKKANHFNNLDCDYEEDISYKSFENNGYLYITTLPYEYYENEIANEYLGTYIINKKGIVKILKNNIDMLFDKNDNIIYFYTVDKNENYSTIIFYDTDNYEYYRYQIDTLNNINYNVSASMYNDNYCEIDVFYDISEKNKTYYVDLFNSKELSEYNATKQFFENGYTYTIKNQKLTIYKDIEQINSFDNVSEYIGNYMFIINDGKHDSVYKVNFKND